MITVSRTSLCGGLRGGAQAGPGVWAAVRHLSASRIGEVQSEGWDWYEMDWRQEGVRCGEVALR